MFDDWPASYQEVNMLPKRCICFGNMNPKIMQTWTALGIFNLTSENSQNVSKKYLKIRSKEVFVNINRAMQAFSKQDNWMKTALVGIYRWSDLNMTNQILLFSKNEYQLIHYWEDYLSITPKSSFTILMNTNKITCSGENMRNKDNLFSAISQRFHGSDKFSHRNGWEFPSQLR